MGVGDGDAEELEVGVHPELPFGAVGLDDEVAEVLGTAVQGRVIVALELDIDLGRRYCGGERGRGSGRG